MFTTSRFFLAIALAVFFSLVVHAQPQFQLSFAQNTLQAAYLNPAAIPEKKIIISLPNVYNHLQISGPSFGDLVTTNANGDKVLDVNAVLPNLEETNQLRNNLSIETLGLSFGAGPLRVHLHHAVKFGAFVKYPKTLPQLLWEGNAQFVGQTIDLGNDFEINGYHEFGLGVGFNIKNVTLAGRVKLLSGIGDASTDRNDISLFTSDDVYQLTLNSDYRVNSSAYLNYDGFGNTSADFNFGNVTFDKAFSKNTGTAFDFGAQVEIGKLKVGASILDIGQITWSEEVKNYTSNGTFSYDGLDLSGAVTGDSVDFSGALDTLEQIFEFEETQLDYTTKLPTKYYLTGSYELTETWRVGATFYAENYRGETTSGFSLGAQASFLKWLTVGANYSLYGDAYANIGIMTGLKFGPVQFLAMTDNVIALLSPNNANFGNARAGLNLVF
ncbi:MAG: hypothetical protein KDC24_08410 [Saprospiraceae bacterium]|nr:hypothetical protein [Saprospiraceae bacterium]